MGDVIWGGSEVLMGEVVSELVILMAAAWEAGEVEFTLDSVCDDEEGSDEVAHVDTVGSAGPVDIDQGDVVYGGQDCLAAEKLWPPNYGSENGQALQEHGVEVVVGFVILGKEE